MKKFTYWVAVCNDDNACYSLIGKTKKSVITQLADPNNAHGSFDPPAKRVIEYTDTFDLFDQVTCEGGGRTYQTYWK